MSSILVGFYNFQVGFLYSNNISTPWSKKIVDVMKLIKFKLNYKN